MMLDVPAGSWHATGADISSHQHDSGNPDWTAYRDDFVIVKATEGTSYANPFYAADVAAARAAGATVGHYHWVSPGSPTQGQHAVDVIQPQWRPGDLRVWLDFEQDGASHADLHAARATIRAAGLPTGTYTYPYFWASNGDPTCSECASDPLWFAWYNPAPISVPPPWGGVALWQYAGTSVTVPGIPGASDHSRALVPLDTLTGQVSSPAAPVPAPIIPEGPDMVKIVYVDSGHPTYLWTGGRMIGLRSNSEVRALETVGVPVVHPTPAELADLLAVSARIK